MTNRSTINGPLGVGFQPFGGTTRSDFDGQIHTLNARFDYAPGSFNYITAGYEFENESFTNPSFQVNPADNSDVDVSQRSHALFVQDQLRLVDDRLQISGAFRAQFFRLHEPRFTPAASAPYTGITFQSPPTAYTGDGSVAYTFRSSGTKLRGHVGNGYRAPSLFERFGTAFDSFFGYSVFGDPRLSQNVRLALTLASIRRFTTIECVSRRLTSTRVAPGDHLRLLGTDRFHNRSVWPVWRLSQHQRRHRARRRSRTASDSDQNVESHGGLHVHESTTAHAASAWHDSFVNRSRSSILDRRHATFRPAVAGQFRFLCVE